MASLQKQRKNCGQIVERPAARYAKVRGRPVNRASEELKADRWALKGCFRYPSLV
jgi:hypothetical protein